MKLLCGTFMFLLVVLTIQVTCAEQENATTTEAAPAVAGDDLGDKGIRLSKTTLESTSPEGIRTARTDELLIVPEGGEVKKLTCRYVTRASELSAEMEALPKNCITGGRKLRKICPELLKLYRTICRRRIPVLVRGPPVGTFVTDIN